MRSKQNSKKVSKKLFTILFTKKGSHYDSLRARLGNKREKPGLANVVQVEVFIEPPTESIDCGYNLELYSEGPANTGSLLTLLSRSDEVLPYSNCEKTCNY